MSLEIQQTTDGNVTTLVLTGDLDTATAGQLESKVKEVLAGEQPGIVFDMGGITYVSSFGLRVIIYTSKAMRAHGDRFAMHSVQDDVMEILTLSGLSKLLKVVSSQEAAESLLAD
ncbi:MAG: STAS domain-containing protein [Thiolinea sp.]